LGVVQALGPTAGKLLSRHERATCLFGGLQAFNSQLTTETLCCRRRARHCAGHYVSPVGEAETGKTYSVSVNPPSMRKCRQHGSCFKADAWAVGLFGIITDHQNSISCISKLGYDSTVDPRYFVRFGRWGHGPNAVANCHFLANVAGKIALRLQQAGTALRAGFSSPRPPPKSSLYLPKAAAPII
jgi:hypothetical protein